VHVLLMALSKAEGQDAGATTERAMNFACQEEGAGNGTADPVLLEPHVDHRPRAASGWANAGHLVTKRDRKRVLPFPGGSA
jgi:hypothetical protein